MAVESLLRKVVEDEISLLITAARHQVLVLHRPAAVSQMDVPEPASPRSDKLEGTLDGWKWCTFWRLKSCWKAL